MVILGNASKMSAAEHPPDAIIVDEGDRYNDDWTPPFDFRDVVRIRTNQKFSDFYELFEEIGEGKFGKVFRCVEKATGLELAAKCIRLKKDADLAKVEKETIIETWSLKVNIMTQMRHKCIAQIYDAFANSSNEIVLIMEIVGGGELFDRVVDDSYILTETAVAMIIYQICQAIKYIHSQNIIHLDLKPENIMCLSLTGNQIKLIDFGLAQYYDGQHDLLFMAGTPEFAAPEVIKYEPLDFHTDMWSLGVITYILLSGQSPFLGDNIALTYCNVERGKWEFSEEFDDNGISEDARDFISKLLIVEKNKRMLPAECLQHPWIVRSKERARASNRETVGKPLDVGKLRSYVRNKRFRRLVFGVLFVNSVARMFRQLQDRKSDGGVEYVKSMLNAVDSNNSDSAAIGAQATTNPAASLIKSAFFAKRRRNATGDEPKAEAKSAGDASGLIAKTEKMNEDNHATTVTVLNATEKSASSIDEGNELHRRPKRSNNHVTPSTDNSSVLPIALDEAADTTTTTNLKVPMLSGGKTSTDGASSADETSRPTSPKPTKRIRDKTEKPKRPKSTSQKASSTEQAAKKPKQGSESALAISPKPATTSPSTAVVPEIVVATELISTNKKPSTDEKQSKPASSSSSGRLGNLLSKFDNDSTATPFVLPVAGVVPVSRRSETEKPSNTIESSATMILKKQTPESVDVQKLKETETTKTVGTKLKLRKTKIGTKKPKSMSLVTDESAGEKITRKSTDVEVSSSKVSSLLRRLEQNDAPPMTLAVSSFVPTPKVEQAIERPASKVVRIESEKSTDSPSNSTTATVILNPNLERKIVQEKKTTVKKVNVRSSKSKGVTENNVTVEHDETRAQHSKCEIALDHRTTTVDPTATRVNDARARFEHAIEANERDRTRVNDSIIKQQRSSQHNVESEASLELRKVKTDGKKIRKKQALRINDNQTETATIQIDSTTTNKQTTVNSGVLSMERQRLKKVTAAVDNKKEVSVVESRQRSERKISTRKASDGSGVNENIHESHANHNINQTNGADSVFKSAKKVAFSTDSLNIDGPVPEAALKAWGKRIRSANELRSGHQLHSDAKQSVDGDSSDNGGFADQIRARARRSLQLDDDDNSLLQAQQDAFDFSLLRSKLENRLMGRPDNDSDSAYVENYQAKMQTMAEIRTKLTDTGNIQRAMLKWQEMDRSQK
ncbi:Stretchin-Mlck [Aphelenchoides besseyi]|nr:Stretchin-Mlck [Aphelenchoides besseyi]